MAPTEGKSTLTQMSDHPYGVHLTEKFQNNHPANGALVGVVMGSRSDYGECMKFCLDRLNLLHIPFEAGVTSMHRTHERALSYSTLAAKRGIKVIIACAGGSAHLPGMDAASSLVPVLAVAPNKPEADLAAVYSTIRMPSGVPAAFIGFGQSGAENAALFTARLLAPYHPDIMKELQNFTDQMQGAVPYTCY